MVGETVLVLCRANLVRSPLAAGLLREALARVGRGDVEVRSAGLVAVPGARPPTEVVRAGEEVGIDLREHRASSLERESLAGTTLILAMAGDERDAVQRLPGGRVETTFTLHELARLLREVEPTDGTVASLARSAHRRRPFVTPGDDDVPDPSGGSMRHCRSVASAVQGPVEVLAAHLERHVSR